MVCVSFAVEQDHFGNGENRLYDGVHLGGIAPFGKVGNTLHQLSRHEPYSNVFAGEADETVCPTVAGAGGFVREYVSLPLKTHDSFNRQEPRRAAGSYK